MQRSLLCLIAGIIFALPFPQGNSSEANAQTQSASLNASFAGCYELKLGRWWPWSFGEDNEFVTPPTKIQLLPVPGTVGFEQNGFVIRRIPPDEGSTFGRRRSSYWQVRSGTHVDLIWTNGLSGVTVNLRKHGDKLRGWAHPHFDFPTLPRIMHVTARPIACDVPH